MEVMLMKKISKKIVALMSGLLSSVGTANAMVEIEAPKEVVYGMLSDAWNLPKDEYYKREKNFEEIYGMKPVSELQYCGLRTINTISNNRKKIAAMCLTPIAVYSAYKLGAFDKLGNFFSNSESEENSETDCYLENNENQENEFYTFNTEIEEN